MLKDSIWISVCDMDSLRMQIKGIGMLEKMTQLDIYLCYFVLPSFIFRVILSSFISFITRIEREKASVHVPSRNNLIFQSIPQSVDGQQQQQNYFHPNIYLYLLNSLFVMLMLLLLCL